MSGRDLAVGAVLVAIWNTTPLARSPALCESSQSATVNTGQRVPEVALNDGVAKSPRQFQNGTATIELVFDWLAREVSYLPGQPSWITREQDLDLDGTPDLLISDPRLSGSGGHSYWAFLRTSQGLRFIGGFLGDVRALPPRQGRVIIASNSGSGASRLQLAEIRPDGLHQVASATLATGDGGTEEGNRMYQELMKADSVSNETLRRVFGAVGGGAG